MDEKKLKVDEFAEDLRGKNQRRKLNREKSKPVPQPKPIKILPGQMRFAPVRVSRDQLQRDSLYERNKRLADEAAAADIRAYLRRRKT